MLSIPPSQRFGDSLHGPHADKDDRGQAEIRLYHRLFTKEDPEEGASGFLACLNPDSLTVLTGFVEPQLASVSARQQFQFERHGCFPLHPDSTPDEPVFNITVNLKDTWARIEKRLG